MPRAPKKPASILYGRAQPASDEPSVGKSLSNANVNALEKGKKRSQRVLAMIRRDMDLKQAVFLPRLRNEEILGLSYVNGQTMRSIDARKMQRDATNLPYRYKQWVTSQATSKRLVVTVSRDAGAGQIQGGPGDDQTGKWVGMALTRVAYEAGFTRETNAVIAEVLPRGTSVMRIGYHKWAISQEESLEAGKDSQSVIGDVLGKGDVEAKPGQDHEDISKGLATMASDDVTQRTVGMEGVAAILARKDSHDQAQYAQESDDKPIADTRMTQHRLWMRKLRVGEQCGWSPYVADTEDTGFWWARNENTVAEVKANDLLFSASFRSKVKGHSSRGESGVFRGAHMPSHDSMGSDARQAQSEDINEDDERIVEWFECWFRRPEMLSGGVRKIVCAEVPDEFCEADEANPHVVPDGLPDAGRGLIPGFYPFYDFTPDQSSIPTPERTCGVPPVAVGMPHYEKLTTYNGMLHESGLRHSLRLYQIHPGLKDKKRVIDALKNGEDGFAFVADAAMIGLDGNLKAQGVIPIQFSGNTLEVDRLAEREKSMWVMVQGMPPAILQGVGTAGTAAQDNMGVAAGERESGALVAYFEKRMADVLGGLRGLMRGCYDDEDWVRLLGKEGAAVMKAWQTGSVDDGDEIQATFGANAQAERTVRTKQIMEAINLLAAQIDPATGMPKYDFTGLLDELMRMLDVGGLRLDASMLAQLQKMALIGKQAMEMMQAAQGQPGAGTGGPPNAAKPPSAGPNAAEGNGPTEGTLAAGASRGTVKPSSG